MKSTIRAAYKMSGRASKKRFLISGVLAICLWLLTAYADRVVCPRCGGSGMIPGPMVGPRGQQIQSYYGCPNCGGWGGGGNPGGKGRGYIDVPSAPRSSQNPSTPNLQQDTPTPSEPDYAQQAHDAEARRQAAAASAAAIARQFELDKSEILTQLKGFNSTDMQLKYSGADIAPSGLNGFGLKGIDSNVTVLQRASELGRGLDRINVPPPIPQELAVIGFGQLAQEDELSKRILLGLDEGLAVAKIIAKIKGVALPETDLLLIAGKSFIAAEDAADVYLAMVAAIRRKTAITRCTRLLCRTVDRPCFLLRWGAT